MEASEAGIKGKPTPDRTGSLLIRLFGLFAVLFGLPYLTQGVNWLIALDPGRYTFFILLIKLVIISLDFVIGLASIFIGAGLFFRKEWARKAWLAFLIVTLVFHFHVIVIQSIAGFPATAALYKWIGVVVLVTIISWAYLSKATIRARFH